MVEVQWVVDLDQNKFDQSKVDVLDDTKYERSWTVEMK